MRTADGVSHDLGHYGVSAYFDIIGHPNRTDDFSTYPYINVVSYNGSLIAINEITFIANHDISM